MGRWDRWEDGLAPLALSRLPWLYEGMRDMRDSLASQPAGHIGVRLRYAPAGWEVETMNWRDYISVDPNVMHGVACIGGTRVPVSVVLDNLAARVPEERLLAEYPRLTPDAIRAVLAYAAELAREQTIALYA